MTPQSSAKGHQLRVLLSVGLRNLWQRPLYLASILLSFIFLAMIVTTLFSVREGLVSALESSAEPNLWFVQSNDSPSELTSKITRSQAAQVAHLQGAEAVSPEWVTLVRLTPDGQAKEYIVRGVTPAALTLRDAQRQQPLLRIVSGRNFEPGRNELIVGESLANHYAAFRPGNQVRLRDHDWKIVGTFSTGGSPRQSEFVTDLEHLRTFWGEGLDYNLVAFTAQPGKQAADFQQQLEKSLRDKLSITNSREHYAGGSESLMNLLLWFGVFFSLLAGVAVTAGNIALSESLIANQQDQLAMMRLLGFGRVVGLAYVCQIVVVGLAGSLAGVLLSMLLFSGITFTTFDHAREMVFLLTVNGKTQLAGVIWGVLVSLIASLLVLPAIGHALKGK